jgi:hypothetical protein
VRSPNLPASAPRPSIRSEQGRDQDQLRQRRRDPRCARHVRQTGPTRQPQRLRAHRPAALDGAHSRSARQSPSRQPHGHSEQAYALEGIDPAQTLGKLRDLLSRAPSTSGWTPFWVPTRGGHSPLDPGSRRRMLAWPPRNRPRVPRSRAQRFLAGRARRNRLSPSEAIRRTARPRPRHHLRSDAADLAHRRSPASRRLAGAQLVPARATRSAFMHATRVSRAANSRPWGKRQFGVSGRSPSLAFRDRRPHRQKHSRARD